jgi:hypothetical protein
MEGRAAFPPDAARANAVPQLAARLASTELVEVTRVACPPALP